MGENELIKTIESVVEKIIGPVSLKPEMEIEEELDLDSLDMMNVLMDLEDAFQIRIPDEHLGEFHTVQDVIDEIQSLIDRKE